MAAIYKILSVLLSYPEKDLQYCAPEMLEILSNVTAIPGPQRARLIDLIVRLSKGDLLDAQSAYVDLFDRTRALSLHLFEHVHGESRDRGQAMVSLRERYQQAGLDIAANELPDYLPLFLEFLSRQAPEEARTMLADTNAILAAMSERLKGRNSDYAAIFECLIALSQSEPDSETLSRLRETKVENPQDLAALDRAWEEAEVRFGPGDAAQGECPRADDMLRKMNIPANTVRSAP